MASATTYRELQDRVLDLISKSDTTTRNRVKNWLNMGQNDFVIREVWPFREEVAVLTTVQGTQEYSLISHIPDIDAQNIVSVAIQGSSGIKLPYTPFQRLRAEQPDFDVTSEAVPQTYYLRAGSIGFWPLPNDVYSIEIDYYKLPTEMDADADEPMLPVGYREALIHYALSMEQDFNTDPDLAVKSMNRYEQVVTLARNNLLVQPLDQNSFRIVGPADSAAPWTGMQGEIY